MNLINIDVARLASNFNHSDRFTILVMVQDWVFEENLSLLRLVEESDGVIARLELALLDHATLLREERARRTAFHVALEYAENANFNLATENADLRRLVRQYGTGPPTRRLRRRLTYEEEVDILSDSSGETTELEELPTDPEDVEL